MEERVATPLWTMIAAVTLALSFGALATVQTAAIDCKHHTIDACIPLLEGAFGVAVATITFLWLATSRGRGRSIQSGLGLAVIAIALWTAVTLVGGPIVCADPGADDVVCSNGLFLGVAAFAVVAAGAWRTQKRLT